MNDTESHDGGACALDVVFEALGDVRHEAGAHWEVGAAPLLVNTNS